MAIPSTWTIGERQAVASWLANAVRGGADAAQATTGAAIPSPAEIDTTHVGRRSVPRGAPALVERVMSYIETHYRYDVHLRHAAEHLRVSRYYLSRVLRQTTGRGFPDYLREARVAAAHSLLMTDSVSVKEAGAHVGYRGSTQFCRSFKRIYGFTPGRLRGRRAVRSNQI